MTSLILHGASSPASTLASSQQFDTLTGVKQNVVHAHFPIHYGYNPDQSPKDLAFPIDLADQLWRQNQLFMATLGTWNLSDQSRGWTSADVLAGHYDVTLHALARRIATWRHPLFIRLDPEFNGTWSKGWFMPGPDFAALWRYIVTLFRADGATNVTWVWCPNQLDPVGSSSSTAADKLAAYYPGPDYVDWTGFDAFNGAAARNSPWQTWAQVAQLTYATLAKLAPDKPIFVGEFACHDTPGNKATWIRDTLTTTIPRDMPLIRGLSWFNRDDPGNPANWSLGAANGSALAYTTALKSGPYATIGTMPPDLQPIKPLQSVQSWGEPPPDLRAKLAEAERLFMTWQDIAHKRDGEITTLQDQLTVAAVQHAADVLTTTALQDRLTIADHKISAWQKANADLLQAS